MSGHVFHAPFISTNPKFKLYGVFERTKNQAQERYANIKTFRSLESMLADDNIESGETGTSAMFSMMQQFLKSQYVKDILNEAITTATLNTHNTATTIQPIIPPNDKKIVDSIANVAETQKKTK